MGWTADANWDLEVNAEAVLREFADVEALGDWIVQTFHEDGDVAVQDDGHLTVCGWGKASIWSFHYDRIATLVVAGTADWHTDEPEPANWRVRWSPGGTWEEYMGTVVYPDDPGPATVQAQG